LVDVETAEDHAAALLIRGRAHWRVEAELWANCCWIQLASGFPVQVVAEFPWNWRQASGDVSHTWLMGFVAVPSRTLFTS
jgi:SH3-like domain-containing protein